VEGPVLIECKAFAVIDHPQYGIWGGTTEKERGAIRRSPARREYLFGQLRRRLQERRDGDQESAS